ncbi:sugar phosphate isomerase/epimerase family protein [Prosthecomicrobium pneumaticum]|uniref:Inosose dehydratase n=1 Tax=Prosthecomicrobium pneumaticum TaxID=81895 RepID=A0A7W9FLL2_9HYPH|nr:sugar phosphate isomerase/epimerase [Prosthecomicrobium pneumaticum]MBB5752927.1 inosose dehydratase [Prosthecomicrobium pneumaticum]
MTSRAARQRFSIGYHLNSWDLAGLPLRPALDFLAGQGFGWFEILAFTSLSDQYARKYMQIGDQAPMGVTTDTDILRRYAILSEAQSEVGIRLSSLYCNAIFTNPVAWPYERDVLVSLARLLKGFGAPVLVLGGGPSERVAGPHTAEDYKTFCRALEDIGRRTRDLGIETVYHPHLDTFVERRDQLDRMMDELDTRVAGLCIDPAHLAHTNSDPVDALKTYVSAVRYMHLKDTRVDPALVGFDRYKAFCELGAGVVDLPALVDVLLDAEYDGLAIIELDMSEKTAEASAIESIAYVRDTLGLALTPAAEASA